MGQALDRDDIDVYLREVGLRDGLQNVSTFFPTEATKGYQKHFLLKRYHL